MGIHEFELESSVLGNVRVVVAPVNERAAGADDVVAPDEWIRTVMTLTGELISRTTYRENSLTPRTAAVNVLAELEGDVILSEDTDTPEPLHFSDLDRSDAESEIGVLDLGELYVIGYHAHDGSYVITPLQSVTFRESGHVIIVGGRGETRRFAPGTWVDYYGTSDMCGRMES